MIGPPAGVWLGVAGVLTVLALPSPAKGRVHGLGGLGRLRPVRARVAVTTPPAHLRRGAGVVAVALAVLLAAHLAGPALGIGLAAVLGTGATIARDARTRRDRAAARRELATAIALVAAELDAGARPSDALAAAADCGSYPDDSFAAASARARAGDDAGALLLASAEPSVRTLGSAWRLAHDTGAALSTVVQQVAADLAAEQELRRQVSVALAGPRSSAVVLGALPLVGLAMGSAMGADPVGFLSGGGVGGLVCCAGALLDCAGVLWVRRIVRAAETS